MGLWETDAGIGTRSAPVGAVIIVIIVIMAGNKGGSKGPR